MDSVFRISCNYLGIDPDTVNVELEFVTVDEMRELNMRTRGVDAPTDVLAFPMLDIVGGRVPCARDYPLDINPDTNKLELGSVVVCRDYAELPIEVLLVHGFLHLLGYDHATCEDEKRMFELTDRILEGSGK